MKINNINLEKAGAFVEEQWKTLLDALVKSDKAESVGGLLVTSEKASVID